MKADPRVSASQADLAAQLELATTATDGLSVTYDGYYEMARLREAIADRLKTAGGAAGAAELDAGLKAADAQALAVQTGTASAPGLGPVNRDLARYFNMTESGDAAPSQTLRSAVTDACDALGKALEAWRGLAGQTLPALNRALGKARLKPVPAATVPAGSGCHL